MGLRGRPPTPTAILSARGSWRAKTRQAEPKPENKAPSCPKWLSKEAKAEWRRQAKWLASLGLASVADRAALAAYCQAWAEAVECDATLAEEGLVLRSDEGGVYQHPLVSIRNKAIERFLKIAQQFGFTPSARVRVKGDVPAEPAKDGKARFFKGA